jgi:hypothetical protein
MNVATVVVSANATTQYNCLAWTLGITTSWIWPWSAPNVTKVEFDAFYQSHGFTPAGAGPIAVFGLNLHAMTHASISGPGRGPRWESKCGAWLRIRHGLAEMEGGTLYGDVVGFYSLSMAGTLEPQEALAKIGSMKTGKLSKAELTFLKTRVQQVSPELRKRFAEAYRNWREACDHPLIVISSNPVTRTQTPEFLELISLGAEILPLLMEKLADPDEFFALQAVDRLLRPGFIVSPQPDDPAVLLGEQGRALETLKQWIRTQK